MSRNLRKRLQRLEEQADEQSTGILELVGDGETYHPRFRHDVQLTRAQAEALEARSTDRWVFVFTERGEAASGDGASGDGAAQDAPLTMDDLRRHNEVVRSMTGEERAAWNDMTNFHADVVRRVEELRQLVTRIRRAKYEEKRPARQWAKDLPWPPWLEECREKASDALLKAIVVYWNDWKASLAPEPLVPPLPRVDVWTQAYRAGEWDVEAWKDWMEAEALLPIALTREAFETEHRHG